MSKKSTGSRPTEIENTLLKFKSGKLQLSGYFTSPASSTKYPTVLLLEGSGKSSEENESEDSAFRKIAFHLAENGIASFRFNKRGSGYNSKNGHFYKATLYDNYADSKSALQFLKAHPRVDGENIFVLGQSMGGTRASKLAAESSSVKGLILVATPTRNFSDFNNEQLEFLYKFKGMPEKKIQKAISDNTEWINSVQSRTYNCDKDPKCKRVEGVGVVDEQSISYWEQAISHNQPSVLKTVDVPKLIIQGTSDWVVSVEDAKLAKKTLEDSENKNFEFHLLDGFDHFFVNNETKEESLKYMVSLKSGKIKQKPLHREFKSVLTNWLHHRL